MRANDWSRRFCARLVFSSAGCAGRSRPCIIRWNVHPSSLLLRPPGPALSCEPSLTNGAGARARTVLCLAGTGMRPCSLLRRHKTTGSTVPSLRVRPLGMEISGTGMEISATEGLKGSGEGKCPYAADGSVKGGRLVVRCGDCGGAGAL